MQMKYEKQTSKSFEKACEDLKKSLSDVGFGVLYELNFKDKLEEKGLEFEHDFKIFEVCNPKKAKEVLDIHLEMGYFLPCKMAIYEKDTKVYIGMLSPSYLIEIAGVKGLDDFAREVEKDLKAAVDKSV